MTVASHSSQGDVRARTAGQCLEELWDREVSVRSRRRGCWRRSGCVGWCPTVTWTEKRCDEGGMVEAEGVTRTRRAWEMDARGRVGHGAVVVWTYQGRRGTSMETGSWLRRGGWGADGGRRWCGVRCERGQWGTRPWNGSGGPCWRARRRDWEEVGRRSEKGTGRTLMGLYVHRMRVVGDGKVTER